MTSTEQDSRTTVTASTEVAAPQGHAFRFFTEEIGRWWNADHHIIEAELAEMVFEPRVGGNIYELNLTICTYIVWVYGQIREEGAKRSGTRRPGPCFRPRPIPHFRSRLQPSLACSE